MRGLRAAPVCVLVLLLAVSARAESRRTLAVKVVEIAGGRAYLAPGQAAGVGLGSVVVFRNRRYRVVGATDSNAVVEMNARELRVGMSGRAEEKV